MDGEAVLAFGVVSMALEPSDRGWCTWEGRTTAAGDDGG
jgi:hypothetical protein